MGLEGVSRPGVLYQKKGMGNGKTGFKTLSASKCQSIVALSQVVYRPEILNLKIDCVKMECGPANDEKDRQKPERSH